MQEKLFLEINMEKEKNKKRTLTISSTFNKKVKQTSFDKSGKKEFIYNR